MNNMRATKSLYPIITAMFLAVTSHVSFAQPPPPGGTVFISGDDADDGASHCPGNACGRTYATALAFVVGNSRSGGTGIIAIGVNAIDAQQPSAGSPALDALLAWNLVANGGPNAPITHARTDAEIAAVTFSDFAAIYLPSSRLQDDDGNPNNDGQNTIGGITTVQIAALNLKQAEVVNFVNILGGGLMALTEAGNPNQYGWLPLPLFTPGTRHRSGVRPTPEMGIAPGGTITFSPGADETNLNHGCCYHTIFTGPVGFSGLRVLAYDDHNLDGVFDLGTTIVDGEIVDGDHIVIGSSHKCMHDLASGRSATAVGRRCGCARARYAAVQSSVAQSTAACADPSPGGGLLGGSLTRRKLLIRCRLRGDEP